MIPEPATGEVFALCGDVVEPELAGWRRVLDQERQAHIAGDGTGRPVWLVGDRWPDGWRQQLEAGGVIIASGAARLPWEGRSRPQAAVTRLHWGPEQRVIAAPALATLAPDLDGDGHLAVHEDRLAKTAGPIDRAPLVTSLRIGEGLLIVCWAPVGGLLMARGDRLRTFADHSPVTERVCSVDKAPLLELMTGLLRRASHWLGLPYVRPTNFPGGRRSALVVRVDVDGVFGDHTRRLSRAFADRGLPVSFFFNGAVSDQHPGELEVDATLHQLGQHGYQHDVYATVEENLGNLEAGERWVSDHLGVAAEGFVAPRGLWNPALERALLELGYRYSSDFGLEFDSLPFRTPGGVLQLPVHPYSPERAARHHHERGEPPPGDADDLAHYQRQADVQLAANRAVHVYGHPERLGAIAEPLADQLAAFAARHQLPVWTLRDYAAWWERREAATVRLWRDEDAEVPTFVTEGADGHALDVTTTRACELRHDGAVLRATPNGPDGTVTLTTDGG